MHRNLQVWRSQRQLSNPAFRRAAVASYGAAMSAGAQRLVETWKARRHSGAVDVFRDYNELVRSRCVVHAVLNCVIAFAADSFQHATLMLALRSSKIHVLVP